ncbi:splicing factor 3B subunit 2-like isoform X2 [Kryptolebias marmoratus]|uniref:splicing factor 3B subunit 2-like isoform X2 n=1 Tax=Kryptolebias marmoratus TaxID=37003 RepID=UPI000D531256|nr:splicing factor 3B subunit 2-like isoform X2 [Kryptolebias marmoratus]
MPEAELNLTPTHPPPEQPIGSPEPPGSGVLVEPRDPPDLGEEEEEARRRSVRRTRSMMSDQEAQDRDRDRDHAQVQVKSRRRRSLNLLLQQKENKKLPGETAPSTT